MTQMNTTEQREDEVNENPEDLEGNSPVDPWAAAFEAIGQAGKGSSETADNGAGTQDAQESNEDTDANQTQQGNEGVDAGEPGGLLHDVGTGDQINSQGANEPLGYSEEEVEAAIKEMRESAEQRAIKAVVEQFIKANVMHNPETKALGAYIEHPSICKKDSDGVPRFYNPETGKEFTGDNPRRQAAEWCEDYNKELSEEFNKLAGQAVDQLMEQRQPEIEVLKFSATYDSLDPVRKTMFDSLIEDYEVTNNQGEVIGYSCDLNKALAQVDRQVAAMRTYTAGLTPKPAPTGPALDMKTGNSTVRGNADRPNFKSLEEAMEWQQNQLLQNQK